MAIDVHVRMARLDTEDHSGDVMMPGFFGGAQGVWVPILPSHQHHHIPMGLAHLYEKDNWALADLEFNRTAAAQQWLTAIVYDYRHPHGPTQQYSYAFKVDPDGSRRVTRDGRSVRQVWRGEIVELGPVLVGASAGPPATLALGDTGKGDDMDYETKAGGTTLAIGMEHKMVVWPGHDLEGFAPSRGAAHDTVSDLQHRIAVTQHARIKVMLRMRELAARDARKPVAADDPRLRRQLAVMGRRGA